MKSAGGANGIDMSGKKTIGKKMEEHLTPETVGEESVRQRKATRLSFAKDIHYKGWVAAGSSQKKNRVTTAARGLKGGKIKEMILLLYLGGAVGTR